MDIVKKITSYILIGVILFMTIIALLGIWEVIDLREVIRKIVLSLFVVFIASVVVLFIFSVLIKNDSKKTFNN